LHIAHGDIQHGNILVDDSEALKLVDYDGVFLPSMKGEMAPDNGHRNFVHPRRTPAHFNAGIDNFPAINVFLSMRALAVDASLFERYNVDENLLFRMNDFEDTTESPLFNELKRMDDPVVAKLARKFEVCCLGEPDRVPFLNDFLSDCRDGLYPKRLMVLRHGHVVTQTSEASMKCSVQGEFSQAEAMKKPSGTDVSTPRSTIKSVGERTRRWPLGVALMALSAVLSLATWSLWKTKSLAHPSPPAVLLAKTDATASGVAPSEEMEAVSQKGKAVENPDNQKTVDPVKPVKNGNAAEDDAKVIPMPEVAQVPLQEEEVSVAQVHSRNAEPARETHKGDVPSTLPVSEAYPRNPTTKEIPRTGGVAKREDEIVRGSNISEPAQKKAVDEGKNCEPSEPLTADEVKNFRDGFYVVRTGETLDAIARRLGFRVFDLQSANRSLANAFQPGDKLKIPDYRIYEAKRGEALKDVAQRFGVTVISLMAFNGLNDPILSTDRELRIKVMPLR
jgi:LysM repeat protein